MFQLFTPLKIFLILFFGMTLSLIVLAWLIVSENFGYKGPSKVFSEKFKRSIMRHPEMRDVNPDEELFFANFTKSDGSDSDSNKK